MAIWPALIGCDGAAGPGAIGGGSDASMPPDGAAAWSDAPGSVSDAGASTCPANLPADCPADAPTWQVDIQPIVQARCVPCHQSGGLASDRPLDSYEAVYKRRSAALNQVYACRMPQAGATPLTSAERLALLTWFVCGAPGD